MKHNKQTAVLEFLSSFIEIVVHATEDKMRIISSILSILEIPLQEKFNEIQYEGHWGNKILRLTTEINNKGSNPH